MSRNIQFDKLLVNYIRDDVALFESGNVNVIKIYTSIINSLREFEKDKQFRLRDNIINNDIRELEVKVTDEFKELKDKLLVITEDSGKPRNNQLF